MSFSHNPKPVTDNGLIWIDAANHMCYPGSGTAVYNLTQHSNQGSRILTTTPSMIGGTTWNSNGYWTFDGVNSVIYFGALTYWSTNGNSLINQMSIEYWQRGRGTTPTTGTSPAHIGWTYGMDVYANASELRFWVHDGSSSNYARHVYEAGEDIRDDNIWRQIVVIANGTRNKIYINGVLKANDAGGWPGTTNWHTNGLHFGRGNNNSMYFWKGDMGIFKMYGKELSADEVMQNFQAHRGRFGI